MVKHLRALIQVLILSKTAYSCRFFSTIELLAAMLLAIPGSTG